MENLSQYIVPVLQVIWIDLLLSGDNAVVIALACRSLPENQRKLGMFLGAGTAIGLGIIFAIFMTFLLNVPFLKIIGGLLLLWIAVKLALGEEGGEHKIEQSANLWRAVRTIAIADAVMSLDNVIAISAVAQGNIPLFVFGLLLSIPLIIFGSTLLSSIIDRFPIIVWAGAGLLGWIAGEMLVADPFFLQALANFNPALVVSEMVSHGHGAPSLSTHPIALIHYGAGVAGAGLVLALAYVLKGRRKRAQE